MAGNVKKRLLIGGGAVIILAFFIVSRLSRPAEVPAVTVVAQPAVETVLATGRVVGEKTIPLSFVRSGRMGEELVQDGDRVKEGQALMRLDGAQEETAVVQKRNALATARLNLEKLRTVDLVDMEQKVRQARASADYAADYFRRHAELYEKKSITFQLYEQSRRDKELADSALAAAENQLAALKGAQRELSELQVAQAQNELRRAQIDLRDTVLRAPFDGRVIEHFVHRGEFVQAGQRILTFIPDSPRTYFEIQVDEANVGKLVPGQKATISSPAFPGRVYEAVVERITPIVDTQRGTFNVRLVTDGPGGGLLAESSVSVQVVVGETAEALLLDQRFILREGRDSFVYADVEGRARRRSVTARDLGGGLFAIESGLESGDTVLLPLGLEDGMKVKPASAGKD
jgi:HlyD family secretion protein